MAKATSNCAPAQINRRRLLSAIPAVAVLPAMAAVPAMAEATETPIQLLFREWQVLRAKEDRINEIEADWESEVCKAAGAQTSAIEDRIFAEPGKDLADMMLKIIVATNFGDWEHRDQAKLWHEARTLIGGAA